MAFHEVLFPTDISYGSKGGPTFHTAFFGIDSGFENRNPTWVQSRCEYDVVYGVKAPDQMDALIAFFMARQGRAAGFRFLDPSDFSVMNEQIAIGDGVTTTFQITKTYSSPAYDGTPYNFVRNIYKVAWNTVTGASVGGVQLTETSDVILGGSGLEFQIDYNSGLILFEQTPAAGAPIMIDYLEFHVPVRFDVDFLNIRADMWVYKSAPSIPLIEIRDFLSYATLSLLNDQDYGDFDLGPISVIRLIPDFGDFDLGISSTPDDDLGSY